MMPQPVPRRRHLVQAALAVATGAALPPARGGVLDAPECIAPAKPGGGFELTCKLVGDMLGRVQPLARPLRISYLPGGIGAVAYDRVVTQRLPNPDALVVFSGGSLLNLAQGKFGRHGIADVRWVAALGTDHGALAVHQDSPLQTLRDLDSLLKRDSARVIFGAGGTVGSQDWVKAALVVRAAGHDHKAMRFVSFEGGGEAIAALGGKHVTVVCGDAAEAMQAIDAGARIRILAILSDKRLPAPRAGIPTGREQGLDLVWPVVRGVYVGQNVSDEDYRQWVELFQAAMASPGYDSLRASYGLAPFSLTGKALTAFVAQRVQEYQAMARTLGLRAGGG